MPNPTSSTPFVPLSRTNWDMLFQPFFDELLTPPPSVDHPTPKVIAPIAKVVSPKPTESTGLPFLTTVNQDAPSLSKSQTTPETQPPIIPNDVEEDNHDTKVAHMVDTPMVEKSKLNEDKEGKVVDPLHYRSMIGTILYLKASRRDLQFAICKCARLDFSTMGVSTGSQDSKPYFFNDSKAYLDWLIKMPLGL
nr:uncharacterized mitochondrial protein AtMg00810-like [Tanacetum cinerariifolium]